MDGIDRCVAMAVLTTWCVQVSELETALEKEQQLGRVLQCSLQGRVVCHCCLSALVPTNVSTPPDHPLLTFIASVVHCEIISCSMPACSGV
jgi:DNA-binding transcriptional regulator of glucitol operon